MSVDTKAASNDSHLLGLTENISLQVDDTDTLSKFGERYNNDNHINIVIF